MDYLPVHLYNSVKNYRMCMILTMHYDQRDLSIAKMKRLIDVSIKRIQDLNRIPANAGDIISGMDPSNLATLAVHLYNLQTNLCA